MTKLEELKNYQKDISDLQYTINLLNWNFRINTPENAKKDLINLISVYEEKLFKLKSASHYGNLLKFVISGEEIKTLEEAEQRYIHNLYRKYEQNKKIPVEFQKDYSKLKRWSNHFWEKAKETNNYEIWKPYFKEIIEMTKIYHKYINPESENLYDVMLNEYEIGITSSTIDKLFEELKEKIIPLIPKNLKEKTKTKYYYSKADLKKCAEFLLNYIGFDLNRGLIDFYTHGFTDKIGINDVRIAINYKRNLVQEMATTIHEGGHGIFEQNVKFNLASYENTIVENLYALHESQSRFFENILGRNINFWIPIYNKVKQILLIDTPLEDFISELNQVSPGLIRIEADELTYCLHIIIRYEIERDIFNGKITVDEIPDIWNKKMKEYLNVEVDTDSNGFMQDIQWSNGSFGYFPTYLLGTIYDGMFLEAIENDLGNIDEILRNGEILKITNYLIEKIYKNGEAYTSPEIIKKMCKKEISADPLVKYFEQKFKKEKTKTLVP